MAYLAMMAVRLLELHRVLKPTGSLYLHCDPTASHYLKVLLDAVFGAENFGTRSFGSEQARTAKLRRGSWASPRHHILLHKAARNSSGTHDLPKHIRSIG